MKHVPNFITILLSNMRKSYLKNTHKLFSSKLFDNPLNYLISTYYHQTIELLESEKFAS